MDLCDQRGYDAGGNALPIMLPSIVAWMDEEGIDDPEERREYRHLVRLVDARWRVLQSRRIQREANKHSKNPRPIPVDDEEENGDEDE